MPSQGCPPPERRVRNGCMSASKRAGPLDAGLRTPGEAARGLRRVIHVAQLMTWRMTGGRQDMLTSRCTRSLPSPDPRDVSPWPTRFAGRCCGPCPWSTAAPRPRRPATGTATATPRAETCATTTSASLERAPTRAHRRAHSRAAAQVPKALWGRAETRVRTAAARHPPQARPASMRAPAAAWWARPAAEQPGAPHPPRRPRLRHRVPRRPPRQRCQH